MNPDKISVQLVGTETLETLPIDSLEYSQEGSETLTIPYYRGYTFSEFSQELGSTHTYTINRQNLVSYKITAFDEDTETTFSSATNNPYLDSTYTIVFDNTIESVGTTITPLFSRLPKNLMTANNNTSLNILMKVTSDQVTITRTILEVETSETKSLQEYDLHTFENGKKLKALKLNVSTNSELNDYYSLTYKKSDSKIYYSNKYIGNPLELENDDFSNQFQFAFSAAKSGVRFNNGGAAASDGFLKLTVTNETIPATTSYLVVAPPYLAAMQMDVNILRTLQNVQTADIDYSKVITKYFPVKSQNQSTIYNPFAGEKISIGTQWVNALSNYIFDYDTNFKQQYGIINPVLQLYYPDHYQYAPSVITLSGNGNIYYTTIYIYYTTITVRSSYVDDEWVREYFIYGNNVSGIGTNLQIDLKYNLTGHYVPVASSYDGNTVILTNDSFTSTKCQVVSYSNGNLQKLGNEITFVKQSNYNFVITESKIQRYYISSDGLKIILFAKGGINTLVFKSVTNNWDLLSKSSDITKEHFSVKDWFLSALYSTVSVNGMWMALIKDLDQINNNTYILEINIFKFDTTINNWVFLKSIPHNGSTKIFIANNGDIVIYRGSELSRYVYNNVTEDYNSPVSTTGNTVDINDFPARQFCICASADCNTVFFTDLKYNSGLTSQMIKKMNFINNQWVEEELPTSVFPFYNTFGYPGFGNVNRLCLCSNDGSTLLTAGANLETGTTETKYTSENLPSNYVYKFKEIYHSDLDAPLNDITFTQKFNKTYKQYESNPASSTAFNITGSAIEIKEVLPLVNTGTDNGPDNDGVIFKGPITELLDMPTSHKYYNSIKLNQSVTNVSHLMLSYTQKYNDVSFYTPAQPTNNIHFNIDGFFIPNGTYRLNSSTDKGSQISIFDMLKRVNDIVLLKYDCEAIDYTNIPKNQHIHEINFTPTKVYASIVNMPQRTFGDKYSDVFSSIDQTKMTLNNNNDIVWTELTGDDSALLLDKFSLKITAKNIDGLKNIVECLYATNEIVKNFTVINQKNAVEILTTDEVPLFIISPYGQISTSSMNTKSMTFFNDSSTNNVDLFEQIEITSL